MYARRRRLDVGTQQTQTICIKFAQRCTNVIQMFCVPG